jgi:hypothetical protein
MAQMRTHWEGRMDALIARWRRQEAERWHLTVKFCILYAIYFEMVNANLKMRK